MNKKILQVVEYETKFKNQLNESRSVIDTNSPIGQKLDALIASMVVKYGAYNPESCTITIDLSKIPSSQNLFSKPEDEFCQTIDLTANSPQYQSVLDFKNLFATNSTLDVDTIYNSVSSLCNQPSVDSFKAHKDEELVDSFKKAFYLFPNLGEALIKASKKYNISEQEFISKFKKVTGVDIKEYSALVQEGLGDYVAHGAKNLGNKLIKNVTFGQTRQNAQKKISDHDEMNALLTHWTRQVGDQPNMNSEKNLKNYLINQAQYDPRAVSQLIKDHKASFTNPSKTIDKDLLRKFFSDATKLNKAMAVVPVPQSRKPAAKAAPAQPTAPATAPAPVAPITPQDFAQSLANVPANQRAQAILDALPNLSPTDFQTIAGSLFGKKP